jgi:hypothetical protein
MTSKIHTDFSVAPTFDEVEYNSALRDTTSLSDPVVVQAYEIRIFTGKTKQ